MLDMGNNFYYIYFDRSKVVKLDVFPYIYVKYLNRVSKLLMDNEVKIPIPRSKVPPV